MPGVSLLLITVVLVLAVGFPLLLYVLVRDEHEQREITDRAAGERAARRDTCDRT